MVRNGAKRNVATLGSLVWFSVSVYFGGMTTKNHMLRVRFSDSEWEALQTLSESAGMSMSELVRDHLSKVRVRNRKDEKDRVVMLNRINANLNMIARWVNTHRGAADAVEVISHLMAIEQSIKDLAK